MKPKVLLFSKLFLSLFLAFLVSQLLVEKVTFKEVPVVRPSFRESVRNLPKKIAFFPKKFLLRRPSLPPPWIALPVKPTIIAYKPPVFYLPTSTPTLRPITPPPTVTPTFGPSPTRSPYPTSTSTPYPTPTLEVAPSEKKAELFRLINEERQRNGTSPLGYSNNLETAAQAHAEDMKKNNYFSHVGKDGSTPADRAERAGYPSRWVGENIAAGTTSPNQVFSMWMQSDGHRQNMLNPTWKSAGIGVAESIWVLLLGAR